MKIEFNQNIPLEKSIRIGARKNNLVDELKFVLNRRQGLVDLFEYTPWVNIKTKAGDFAEFTGDGIIVEQSSENDTVTVTYIPNELITSRGAIELSLRFEKQDADTVRVWQTLPLRVKFPDSIDPSDSVVSAYPDIIRELTSSMKQVINSSDIAEQEALAANQMARDAKELASMASEQAYNAVASSEVSAQSAMQSAEDARLSKEAAKAEAINAQAAKADSQANAQAAISAADEAKKYKYSGLMPKNEASEAINELSANTLTSFNTSICGDLSIALGRGIEGFDNEWCFEIIQGDTEYNIILPVIHWGLGISPTFSSNTATVCRLYYVGKALCGEWTRANTYSLKGNWRLADNIDVSKGLYEAVPFIIDDSTWIGMEIKMSELYYIYASDGHFHYSKVYSSNDWGGWISYVAQTVDFGNAPIPVSENFYRWFTANASEVTL